MNTIYNSNIFDNNNYKKTLTQIKTKQQDFTKYWKQNHKIITQYFNKAKNIIV